MTNKHQPRAQLACPGPKDKPEAQSPHQDGDFQLLVLSPAPFPLALSHKALLPCMQAFPQHAPRRRRIPACNAPGTVQGEGRDKRTRIRHPCACRGAGVIAVSIHRALCRMPASARVLTRGGLDVADERTSGVADRPRAHTEVRRLAEPWHRGGSEWSPMIVRAWQNSQARHATDHTLRRGLGLRYRAACFRPLLAPRGASTPAPHVRAATGPCDHQPFGSGEPYVVNGVASTMLIALLCAPAPAPSLRDHGPRQAHVTDGKNAMLGVA
jgi:hypothetical protein